MRGELIWSAKITLTRLTSSRHQIGVLCNEELVVRLTAQVEQPRCGDSRLRSILPTSGAR